MNLLQDMVRDVVDRGVDYDDALCALRHFARYYGGQHIYIPVHADTDLAEQIRGILTDAVGGAVADRILDVIAMLYGGVQHYIPLETRAFKKQIALEVHSAYDGTQECMRDLCRKYNCSLTQIYRLWHAGEAQALKAKAAASQRAFDF